MRRSGRIAREPLLWAFLFIATLFALADAGRTLAARTLRVQTSLLTENALHGVELVNRMIHDLDRERLLVDTHIFELGATSMAAIERQLAAVQADFAQASNAYAQLPRGDREDRSWRALQENVAALRPVVAEALSLSRQNLDEQAREMTIGLGPRYRAIDDAATRLIESDRRGAHRALARVATLQRRFDWLFGLVALIGVVCSLAVGVAVTRRVLRNEAQLREYSEALERRNGELDAFAGRVAHDLRGPLTGVTTSASLLERRLHGEPALDRIRRGAQRMSALIEDLLTLSRLSDGAPTGSADPAAVLAQLNEELLPRFAVEGATLRTDVDPGHVGCSDGLLRQVLWNLVDNALKYRRDGVAPEIEVIGRRARDYELRVSDNGTGMSEEDTRRVFDAFYRAPGTSERPGTGLGLSIVKRILEASGGSIAIHSQPGRGTTFVIHLPTRPEDHAAFSPDA